MERNHLPTLTSTLDFLWARTLWCFQVGQRRPEPGFVGRFHVVPTISVQGLKVKQAPPLRQNRMSPLFSLRPFNLPFQSLSREHNATPSDHGPPTTPTILSILFCFYSNCGSRLCLTGSEQVEGAKRVKSRCFDWLPDPKSLPPFSNSSISFHNTSSTAFVRDRT